MLRNILSTVARFCKKNVVLTLWLLVMCGSMISLLITIPADRWNEPTFPTQEVVQRPTISAINIGSGDQVVATGQAVVVNRGTVVTAGRVPVVVVQPTTTVNPTITVNGVVVTNGSFTYNPRYEWGTYHCDCETEHFAPLVITNGNYQHRCGTALRSAYPSDRTISSVTVTGGDYICDCEWSHGGPVTITNGVEICIQ